MLGCHFMDQVFSPASQFLERSSALFCILDKNSTIVQINHAWKTKFGLASGVLVQTSFLSWVHPEDAIQTQEILAQLIAQQHEIVNLTHRWLDKTGNYHWLQWEITKVVNTGKDTFYLYAVAIDITTQKQQELQLKNSEERFHLAIQGANHGLWDWNLRTNEIYFSARWKNMLGYEEHEIPHHLDALCEHVHPDDFSLVWAKIEAYLDKRATHYESLHRMRHKNGSYRWMLARGAALWDENEHPYRMVGTYVDVTEHKHIEQAFQASESRYRAIVQDQTELICRFSPEGTISFVNKAYCRYLDKKKNALIGNNLATVEKLNQYCMSKRLPQLTLEKPVSSCECAITLGDGRVRWQQWVSRAFFDENNKIREYQSVGRDITKRRQAEEALKHSEARLRIITSAAPVILFAVDIQGIITFCRGKALQAFGVSDDEFVGQSIFEQFKKFTQELQHLRASLKGKTITSVTRLSELVLETKYTPLRNEDNQITGVIGVSIDITARSKLETRLKEAVAELETILDNSIIGIAYVKKNKFVWVNQKLEQLLEFDPEEMCGQSFSVICPSQECYHYIETQSHPQFTQGKEYDSGQLIRTKKGKSFWARLVGKAVEPTNLDKGIIWLIEDITLQKQAAQNLRLTATVFETAADGILITDLQNHIQRVNPAFTRITGYSPEEVNGKKTNCLSSGRHDATFYQKIWETIRKTGHWQGEIWNRKKTGEIYVARVSISVITNEEGVPVQHMATISDISRLHENIENIRYLASYDSLTDLPNRSLFHDKLSQAWEEANKHQRTFSLLFIDLDKFKPVNDNLGHATGDKLLQQVAERLRHCVGEEDTLARLGGDEFTAILKDTSQLQAATVANQMLQKLRTPFQLDEHHCATISASIGITSYPKDNNDVDVLLKHADMAMYEAKEKGKGQFCFYEVT